MKYIYIYIIGLCSLYTKAQVNLVPNASFEDTLNCFVGMGVSSPSSSNNYLKNWFSTSTLGTPDYYNSCANVYGYPFHSSVPQNCFGIQSPNNGDAYVGISVFNNSNVADTNNMYVEYITVKLKSILKKNICYYAHFHVSLGEISAIATNQIGMLLSNMSFSTASGSFTNTIQPQIQWDTTRFFTDTLNWVKVSGKFIANGGEEYLTIGNFKDGSHSKKINISGAYIPTCGWNNRIQESYLYIDDVALYELPKPNLGADIKTCGKQDSVVIGDVTLNNNGTNVRWLLREPQQPNTMQLSVTSNTIKVSAAKTATYVMEYEGCTADTIVVNYTQKCPQLSDSVLIIPNVFTPNNDGANDVWQFLLPNNVTLSGVEVYNRWGNLIHSVASRASATVVRWDGRTTSGEPCSEGVYFYTLTYLDANGDEQKHFGYISLLR